ncbi:NAD-dependent epimerase/dehydratase family protein [Luedemannella helvata]|uniref:NAD-dependent epimerase/dehydratase family protein n=1 Tax=Luedemannella helvata TaxID=349315 RepID=A0ABP4WSR3_9ACTN
MKVLVTGVGRFLGAHLAARLAADPRVTKVIGVDTRPPAGDLARLLRGRVTVVTDDLRGVVASVTESGVEAVAHCGLLVGSGIRGGRAAQKEYNIIGTMQLLAAVHAAPAVRKLVVRSSTAAYGASFRDPAVFTEQTPPTEMPRGGFAKDVIEIEGYVRGFRRRRPDVATTVLRLAPIIGPDADTILTRYFALPVVPTVLGRDPRLQFLHADDVQEILVRSVVEDHQGTFNVAGAGVLTLSQAVRRAGRLSMPVAEPGMSAFATLARSLGLGEFSMDQLDLFVHGRVVDTSRLIAEFGYTPRTTPEAFADMIAGRRLRERGLVRPGAVAGAEQALLGGIRAARQAVGAAVTRGGADV